jgi:hypothetical protein
MWQDIRLTVRGLRKTPVFSLVAIVTFALAIGATTALFSVLNALALRDLPVRDPNSLVQVSGTAPGSTGLTYVISEHIRVGVLRIARMPRSSASSAMPACTI